ncbi:hypothetical protein [Streptomyces sp. MMS24-I29]|uniref:hypothetical protein n=1 Tax=Streptomyces sp. MMS24-I29 TaxID=3351480 RepID=UPI003C79D0B3
MARLLACGLDQSGIADELGISPNAVQGRLRSMLSCVGVGSRRALVHRLLTLGLLSGLALPDVPAGLWDELTERVCMGLSLDVPYPVLHQTIARELGVPAVEVAAVLARVREATGLSDCALVAVAFKHRRSPGAEKDMAMSPGPSPGSQGSATLAQHEAMAMTLLATGLTLHAAADRLDVLPATVERYLRACRARTGVTSTSVRALLSALYEQDLLPPPPYVTMVLPQGPDAKRVADWLGLDVPDAELAAAIATRTGLPKARVERVLRELLVAAGSRGYAGLSELVAHRGLLPPGEADDHPLVGPDGDTVVGRDVQAVRIPLNALQGLLRAAGAERGPVLLETVSLSAVFLLPPRALKNWRAEGSNLIQPGHVYHLPPTDTNDGTGTLRWAVPPQGQLWDAQRLRRLILTQHAARMPPTTHEAPSPQ